MYSTSMFAAVSDSVYDKAEDFETAHFILFSTHIKSLTGY